MPELDTDHAVYSFGGFALDVARGTLARDGVETRLRPKSYAVLRYLVEHSGRLVGKQELLDAVWGSTVVTEGSLTQCIVDIRRALGDADQRLLRTVPRQGFMLDAAVTVTSVPSQSLARDEPAERESAAASPVEHPASRSRPAAGVLLGLVLLAALAGWFIAHRATDLPPEVTATPPATNPANSIAVLRFLDLSPEGDQAYFADGLAEEILHLLAQSPDLRVIARSSSFAFEPAAADIPTVARQLDVAHVLEGSVRRAGSALRITVQLIDAGSQAHLWSRTYDGEITRILDLQREVAADVAAALRVTLMPRSAPESSPSVEAREQFLLGRHLFHRRNPGDLEAAERHFEAAVELDPGYAQAWTALAGAYQVRALAELRDPAHRRQEQRYALERAIAIDPSIGEAHVRLGRYHFAMGDLAAARAAFERAEQVSPDDPLVLEMRALRAIARDEFDDAVALRRRVVQRDPLSGIYRHTLATTLLVSGRPEEALEEYNHARALSPEIGVSFDIARTLLLLGRVEDARTEAQSTPPGPFRDQLTVLIGGPRAASAELRRLELDPSPRAAILLAEIDAYGGELEAAFARLATAAESASARGILATQHDLARGLWHSPLLLPLRDDPRWERLLEVLAFP